MNLHSPYQLILKSIVLLSLCFAPQYTKAQTIPDSFFAVCGANAHFISHNVTPPTTPGPPFSSSAIKTCGKIDVYYEDINSGTGAGFDDHTAVTTSTLGTTVGDIRMATFCQVLNDIQNTFDFANVTSGNLRLYVDLSLTPTVTPATPGVMWYARASPNFDNTTPGITAGYFNEYVTTGVDKALATTFYHGHVQVNFDRNVSSLGTPYPFIMQDDYTLTRNCQIDLYTTLLHEMGHVLGWISLVQFTGTCCGGTSPCNCVYYTLPNTYTTPMQIPGFAANIFSKLDTAITGAPSITTKPSTATLNHLVVGSSGGLYILNATAYDANSNYWLNAFSAPDNYPVFSGVTIAGLDTSYTGSFLSHMDDQNYTYTFRERMSPGDRQTYVMAASLRPGHYKREFSKGEIQTFVRTLGYNLETSYATAHPNVFNHLPASNKMSTTMVIDAYNYMDYTEDNATIDYTMTNNTGVSQTINLSTLPSGDLVDADGDPITIDASTIVNLRGCGNGWNNHSALSWSGTNPTSITYTPRANFYGKAQFGFNINDGNENGAYRVVTIDVKRGNNVSSTLSGGNMVCNGDFEEGSEIRTLANQTQQNSYCFHGRGNPFAALEGKWQGVSFSDSHPFAFHSNHGGIWGHFYLFGGMVVKDSWINCNGTTATGVDGSDGLSYPVSTVSFINPGDASGGHRYQRFNDKERPGSYYYLTDNVTKCGRYVLSFDINRPTDAYNSTPGKDPDLQISLGDSTGVFSNIFHYDEASHIFLSLPVSSTWTTVTDTFWYCSDTASNILSIKNTQGRSFNIDNLSLIQIASPTMTVAVANPSASGCVFSLTSTVTNGGCKPTYSWTGAAGTITSPTSASTTVTPTTITTYTLTVTDYCGTRIASDVITIDPTVGTILGSTSLCSGTSTTLVDATAGGTWTSSNSSVATINPSTGLLSAIAPGTSTISYTLSTGCMATTTVTVHLGAAPITGTSVFCPTFTTTLSSATPGGVWTSSSTPLATITSSGGFYTALNFGTPTITYTLGSCYATFTTTIYPAPGAISAPIVCVGTPITLTNTVGGGTWESNDLAVGTIGSTSGIVSGLITGTTVISYTTHGLCTTTKTVTVGIIPSAILGVNTLCTGKATILTDAILGGTWTSGSISVATITPTTGVMGGIAVGTSIIDYTNSCGFATMTVTVNATPPAISGPGNICEGDIAILSDATTGGVWSSSIPGVGTIDPTTGIFDGIAAGLTIARYTIPATGCFVFIGQRVLATPVAITGPTLMCIGSPIALSDATSGGTWSSSNTSVATVSGGTVTGHTAGTATITYTGSTGCYVTHTVTVGLSLSGIGGPASICHGTAVTLSNATSGGSWTSSNTGVATIDVTTGAVTTVATGTTIITYTLGSCTSTMTVTVLTMPVAITGNMPVCAGIPLVLSDATSGGTWSSDNTTIATVSGGTVTGVAGGTANISYAIGSCAVSVTVTINPLPAAITGPSAVCVGSSITLSDATVGGTWYSMTPTFGTIDATTGIFTGVASGTATAGYLLSTGCIAFKTITVNPLPAAITGPGTLCAGQTISLSDATSGGTWSSSNTTVATIGVSIPMVAGNSAGTTIISYILTGTGCSAVKTITVNAAPSAITGPLAICHGSSGTMSDAITGGVWTSSNTSVATIGTSTGAITTVGGGTTIITYTLSAGCTATQTITIDVMPGAISVVSPFCTGTTTTCINATAGGVWSSSNTAVVSVSPTSGLAAAITAGTVTISYAVGACTVTHAVTVSLSPAAITGPTLVCMGNTITLSDATPGGTWGSVTTTPVIATIGVTSGIVTPASTGVATIIYMLPGGCFASIGITVAPIPSSITGGPMACVGTLVSLSDAAPGGTWSSGTSSTATVSSGGVVTPLTGGTAIISYETSPGCITSTTLTLLSSSCSPCAVFGSGTSFTMPFTSGIMPAGPIAPGKYYIDNTVYIGSATTFNNAIIMMGTSGKLIVDPSGTLTVDNSHLFSCGMWPGIEVHSTALAAGKIKVINHSLIEDADIAISMINPGPAGSSLLIECDDAIFNRNTKGIHIENYPSTSGSYPFLVRNSTFTSRDLSTYTLYPAAWPNNNSSSGLKFPWTPSSTDVYSAPVNMANPSGSAWYSPVGCKNGRLPYCGIWLDQVGAETPSGTLIAGRYVPATYHEIVIGDDAVTTNNDNLNVFDNMLVGICAKTSNVSCLNNLFMNMVADNSPVAWPSGMGTYTSIMPVFYPTGDGIYAGSSLDGSSQKRLRVYSNAGSSYRNSFYGFNNAVESENYYSLYLYNSHMINQTPSVPIWMLPPGYISGSFGYKLSSAHYHDITVNSNNIYNVNTAINLWQLYQPLSGPVWRAGYPAPYQQYLGSCDIVNNTIAPRPAGSGALTNEAIQKGVVVQNALTSYSMLVATGTASGNLLVNSNNIQNVYSGIYLNYNYKQKATSNSNYITLRSTGASGSVGSAGLRYGINHTACTGDAIWTNTVTTVSGTATTDTSMRGIYSNTNTSVNISCNKTIGTARGFEFVGINGGAIWNVNEMQDNIRGLTLNGALIGKQGTPTAASNNRWLGSGWSATTNYHTYVWNGADASTSTLYVKNTPSYYNPTFNFGRPLTRAYIPTSSLITTTGTGSGISCPPPLPDRLAGMGEYESMVRQSFLAAASTMPKKWMSQYELWRTLMWDTVLIDSSAAIAQFAAMAQNSRYAYLTNLETQVADGNVDSAMALLALDIDSMANTDTDAVTGVRMADSITTDNIVVNYQDFYRLYIKFTGLTLTVEDSAAILALAQLCPHKDGMVVYQARALYSYIYNDLTMFNDDSCMAEDSTYRAEWKQPRQGSITAQDIGGQGYQLYPNPNDGNITLQQLISDTGIVRVEIYDVVGRRVYGNKLQFSGKIAKLHVGDIVPGMYLLQLTGTDEKMFRFKFVKE